MTIVKAWWKRHSDRAALRSKIEPWWSRWSVSAALLTTIVFAVLEQQSEAMIALCAFFALLSLHFLLILLRKVKFALMELFAAALVGGTVNGLLLSMPGILTTPLMAAILVLAVIAWVLYGVLKGLICVQVMQTDGIHARLGYTLVAWLTSAAPAFLSAAILLIIFSERKNVISPAYKALIIPFICAGVFGVVSKIGLEWHLRKKALALLNSNEDRLEK